jgi:hypothetical protein
MISRNSTLNTTGIFPSASVGADKKIHVSSSTVGSTIVGIEAYKRHSILVTSTSHI